MGNSHKKSPRPSAPQGRARGQEGYALVALIALMTILALAAVAAAPNIRLQGLREQEREAIIRGEEVSEAIERYVRLMGRPPRSIEELMEGANPPGRTKKIYVLRTYAARDPLSSSGEWLLVPPQSKKLGEFQFALQKYLEGRPLSPSQEQWKNAARVQITGITNLGREDEATGGEDESMQSDVPFIGVASRSGRESVVYYYGIDTHKGWVFTPIYR
jgi:type II secretory pathway pseudopilin PulG